MNQIILEEEQIMVEQTRTIAAQIIIRGGTSQTNHYLQLLLPGD